MYFKNFELMKDIHEHSKLNFKDDDLLIDSFWNIIFMKKFYKGFEYLFCKIKFKNNFD